MTLTLAFTNTKVALDRSMQQIEGILERNGIRESRYTHRKPLDPEATDGEEAQGSLTLEFVQPGDEATRRGVRITVGYQPAVLRLTANYTKKKVKGTTAEMAARALFWYLDTKFKAMQYGLEEFDTAFMPHLVTQLGTTMAERPELIGEAISQPQSIGQLLLPAGRE